MKKRIISFIAVLTAAVICVLPASASVRVTGSDIDNMPYGDTDKSGGVNSADALVILQHSVGKLTLPDELLKIADVNLDSSINSADALAVLQYSVGKASYLPLGNPEYDLLIDKPTSLMNNGAYEMDSSADTSWHIETDGLAAKTVYCISSSVFNGGDIYNHKDRLRFVSSLQGLVNRDFGITHTSLIYLYYDSSDSFWYKYMSGSSKLFNGFETETIKSIEDFLNIFEKQINDCGMILWDPAVPSTSNVAATICSLDGYLPVQYDLNEGSFYNQLIAADKNIEVKQSLVGMFNGIGMLPGTNIESSGSVKCDPYLWALEKYFDRCSAFYMGYIVDGSVCVRDNPFAENPQAGAAYLCCLPNFDYLIARRCFCFDLTCFPYEEPCDDPEQYTGCDSDTLYKILQARYDRANGEFGQMFGFPPWWLKYCNESETELGLNGSISGASLEWRFIEVVTSYNMAQEADAAQPCWMSNGSAFYKYVSTGTKELFVNKEPDYTNVKFDKDTYYFTYYMGDYDSSAWLKNYIYGSWRRDAKRGKTPVTWCFDPNLSDRVPMIFDYVYENRKNNEWFAAGDSGAGYVIPHALFKDNMIASDQYIRELPDADDKWSAYSKKYYDLFDLDMTGFIINGTSSIDSRIMKLYNSFSPVGNFHNSTDAELRLVSKNGTPYLYMQNGVGTASAEDIQESAATMYSHASGRMSGYNFSAYRTVCVSAVAITNLSNAYIEYAAELGLKAEYVDPYTMFHLIKQSGQAKEYTAD